MNICRWLVFCELSFLAFAFHARVRRLGVFHFAKSLPIRENLSLQVSEGTFFDSLANGAVKIGKKRRKSDETNSLETDAGVYHPELSASRYSELREVSIEADILKQREGGRFNYVDRDGIRSRIPIIGDLRWYELEVHAGKEKTVVDRFQAALRTSGKDRDEVLSMYVHDAFVPAKPTVIEVLDKPLRGDKKKGPQPTSTSLQLDLTMGKDSDALMLREWETKLSKVVKVVRICADWKSSRRGIVYIYCRMHPGVDKWLQKEQFVKRLTARQQNGDVEPLYDAVVLELLTQRHTFQNHLAQAQDSVSRIPVGSFVRTPVEVIHPGDVDAASRDYTARLTQRSRGYGTVKGARGGMITVLVRGVHKDYYDAFHYSELEPYPDCPELALQSPEERAVRDKIERLQVQDPKHPLLAEMKAAAPKLWARLLHPYQSTTTPSSVRSQQQPEPLSVSQSVAAPIAQGNNENDRSQKLRTISHHSSTAKEERFASSQQAQFEATLDDFSFLDDVLASADSHNAPASASSSATTYSHTAVKANKEADDDDDAGFVSLDEFMTSTVDLSVRDTQKQTNVASLSTTAQHHKPAAPTVTGPTAQTTPTVPTFTSVKSTVVSKSSSTSSQTSRNQPNSNNMADKKPNTVGDSRHSSRNDNKEKTYARKPKPSRYRIFPKELLNRIA